MWLDIVHLTDRVNTQCSLVVYTDDERLMPESLHFGLGFPLISKRRRPNLAIGAIATKLAQAHVRCTTLP